MKINFENVCFYIACRYYQRGRRYIGIRKIEHGLSVSKSLEFIGSLKYGQDFARRDRDFESIWYWEMDEDCLVIGEVNNTKYKDLCGDQRIYCKIIWNLEFVEFTLCTSLEIFWKNAMDYKQFNGEQRKKFDPNV